MIDGVEPPALPNVDSHVEAKAKPCAKDTWCALDVGHDGPCMVKPRRWMPPSDFGPRRKR